MQQALENSSSSVEFGILPKMGHNPPLAKADWVSANYPPWTVHLLAQEIKSLDFLFLTLQEKKDPVENFGSCLLPQCTEISTEVFFFLFKADLFIQCALQWQDSALSILSKITCGSRQTAYRSLQHLAKHQLCSKIKTLLAWLDAQNGVKNDIKMWFLIF